MFGDEPATVVNIGSHGFTVLEVRGSGLTVFRENSRCSQGKGNFLRQLVERFSLTVEEASALCADVPNPAPLSGRCPVILKTDMTHLANKGEDRARILTGLFDAVCENVMVLVKPGVSPERVLQRLALAKNGERFAYLMPSTNGPCRFGVYNLLNNIVLERLGWRDRVRIWSPKDTGYFDNMPPGTEMLILAGIAASDLLLQAKLDVRPVERKPGGAEEIYQRYRVELLTRLESAARGKLALGPALWEVAGGRLFGVRELLARAGAEFAAMRGPANCRSSSWPGRFMCDPLNSAMIS